MHKYILSYMMFLKQYGKCLQHCKLQRINQKHSKCSMQWKCSFCRNSSLSGFWVCVLCDLNTALSIVLLTITFTLLKKKVSRTLKLFTVKLHRVFIEIPPEERAGEWMNSHLCLILFIWRQALNKQEKSWLTHIIIFSLFKAVLKFYQFFLKPQFMEKTNYFKNTRRKYPDNSILESDILEKRFPECTLSSLKGALLKVPTGYYYFLLREVD